MTGIGLVATDLDGTLVRSDGTISPRTREVLAAVEAAGVPVVFVTGRPLRWTREVFDLVGDVGLAIVSNGALVWSVADDRATLERSFDTLAGLEVCRRIREAVPGSVFAAESLAGISLEHDFVERHHVPDGSFRGRLDDLFDAPAVKVLARHEDLSPEEFWAHAEQAIGDRGVITWSSTSTLLEISAPGVTKATTLEVVAADLGVDADGVIAFGDMPNDLPMLAWAGTSYAVANAHPTVLAAADEVAGANDDDGVAEVLAGRLGL